MPKLYKTSDPALIDLLGLYRSYKDRVLQACPGLSVLDLTSGPMQGLDSLRDAYERAELILFDSYGILNLGQAPVPGMPETLAKLKKMGKQVRVLTNNASLTADGIARFLNELGFNLDASEIISCGHALRSYLHSRNLSATNIYCVGPRASFQYVKDAGAVPINSPGSVPNLDLVQMVVLASNSHMTINQIKLVVDLMKRGIPTVCLNADLLAPASDTEVMEVMGLGALQLEKQSGRSVTMLGKPFPWIFEAVFSEFPELSKEAILMVGDTLYTDVLGALAAGIKSVLAPSVMPFPGMDRGVPEFCRSAGIHPHYYVDSLEALTF